MSSPGSENDDDGLEADASKATPTVVKKLNVIWEDDKIQKYYNDDKKQFWKCLWCGRTFQHWNATKALNHVMKIPGAAVQVCTSKNIDPEHQEAYICLFNKSVSKKNISKAVLESKRRRSLVYLEDAGSALLSSRPPKQMRLSLGTASDVSTGSMEKEKPKTYAQAKIFDHQDEQAESQLTMAIADLIHSCGLPFALANHHKFHRVLKLAKSASSKYKPPGRNRVSGDLLDLNYSLYQEKMHESLVKDADIYGITYFGDGATVKRAPLINIMASSVHNTAACLSIVDCTAHLQGGVRRMQHTFLTFFCRTLRQWRIR